MLYNGQYFRKGTKRDLDELKQLTLPFNLETGILAVIQAETVEKKNEPSVKTIIRNGGLFERSFELDGEQADIYRIDLRVM